MNHRDGTRSGADYTEPHFPQDELLETLAYCCDLLPVDADPVHRERLAAIARVIEESRLLMRVDARGLTA